MKLKCLLLWAILVSGSATLQAQGLAGASATAGQTLTTLRATELRADKLGAAPVLQSIAMGASVRLLSAEGGWALVESTVAQSGARVSGWVRASAVNWQAGAATAAGLSSGREAAGNTALTLGVRSLTPRVNRHALIIGVSRYGDGTTPPLPGARIDKQSATQMAQAMQVPLSNISYLQDEQATADNIRRSLQDLNGRVQEGDRVFIHYSGHGTRFNDPGAGGCVEALLAYDGAQITNREVADLLKSITGKTDKLFVMYDACHSGGLVQAASSVRTRGILNSNDEGLLRPKFAAISDECGRPVNVKTRNLVVEAVAKGAFSQDIIHISASRDNEISFDDELKGGLATQFMRDCMLRDAKDLDRSGAISIDEIKVCAQEKINKRMNNDPNYKAHNLVLSGNAAFVPAWFAQASPVVAITPSGAAALAPITSGTPVAAAPAPVPTPTNRPGEPPPFAALQSALGTAAPLSPVAAAPVVAGTPAASPQLTGAQALQQLFDQRDAKRSVQVLASSAALKIGQDVLDVTVQSDRAGYVFLAMAGSDDKSLYLLFPNDLDQNNKIEAGQKMQLPRPNWRVKAAGPPGRDSLLVLVADGPRDFSSLAANKAGPFVTSLNDTQGRARLGALISASSRVETPDCKASGPRRSGAECSDAYGAAMINIEEIR